MIEIRREQLATLADDRAASLPGRIARCLTEIATAKATSLRPRTLEQGVVAAIDRARAWGITIEWDACRFALLSLELGAAFEQEPWAREILEDAELSPTARMDELEDVWANALASQPSGPGLASRPSGPDG